MASKWEFNESAFRAQLGDSLREVTVTDDLRVKTLDACRAWLQTEGLASGTRTSDDKRIQYHDGDSGQRILTFPARHATAFRIAGGLAACMLLAILLIEFMPKTGSQLPSLAFAERNASVSASVAADANANAQSGMDAMDIAPEAGLAKSAMPDASDGTGDAQFTVGSAETASADPYAGSSAAAEAPSAFRSSHGGFMSWVGGTVPDLLSPEPNVGILRSAADEYETAHPGSDLFPERIFPAMHLKGSLTAEMLAQSVSWRDLTGTAGLWMLPAQTAGGWSVFPILTGPAEVSSIQTHFGEELVTDQGQDWLPALSDKTALKQALENAAGMDVEAWTILDIQGGMGYWVCFTVDGKDWVMPFMDRPEALNLSNGAAYPYDTIKETVAPLF